MLDAPVPAPAPAPATPNPRQVDLLEVLYRCSRNKVKGLSGRYLRGEAAELMDALLAQPPESVDMAEGMRSVAAAHNAGLGKAARYVCMQRAWGRGWCWAMGWWMWVGRSGRGGDRKSVV